MCTRRQQAFILRGPRYYVAGMIHLALSTGTKVCVKHRREARAPERWTRQWRWGAVVNHFTALCIPGFYIIYCNRPISVYRFPRRALDALPATLYGHST
jgi:hypothetical protein